MNFDKAKFNQYLSDFKSYIEHKDNRPLNVSTGLSGNNFLMAQNQEGYKETVYKNAGKALNIGAWNIADYDLIVNNAKSAINKAQNLIFANQKSHFKDKNKGDPQRAADILYSIYCGNDFESSFNDAVSFWGAKYDLIAYLFFIKDKTRYLPISPGNFDEKFAKLGIELQTSRRCSSENYLSFVHCIDELRKHMTEFFCFEVSLLEAHSVIWMMNSVENFIAQSEEQNADNRLLREVNCLSVDTCSVISDSNNDPSKRAEPIIVNGHKIYPRSRTKALLAMEKAGFNCERDATHESFIRKNSNTKYMEPHHLIPMSQSDKFEYTLDDVSNIVCLCSNCHNEIHYGKNAEAIIRELFDNRKEQLEKAKIKTTVEELLKMYECT